jgi:hypothetical protein
MLGRARQTCPSASPAASARYNSRQWGLPAISPCTVSIAASSSSKSYHLPRPSAPPSRASTLHRPPSAVLVQVHVTPGQVAPCAVPPVLASLHERQAIERVYDTPALLPAASLGHRPTAQRRAAGPRSVRDSRLQPASSTRPNGHRAKKAAYLGRGDRAESCRSPRGSVG